MRLSVHPPTCPSTHPSILPAFLSVFLSPTLLPFLSVFLSPTSPPRPSLHPASLIVSLGPPLPGPLLRAQAVLCTEGGALLPSGTESVSSPTVPCQVEGQASTPGVLLSLFSHHCPHPGGRNKPWAVWAGGRAGPGDPLCVPCTRLRSPRLPSQPLAWSTHVISRTSPAAEMSAVMRASVGPAHSPGTQGGAARAPLGTERGASRMKVLGPTGPHVPGAT